MYRRIREVYIPCVERNISLDEEISGLFCRSKRKDSYGYDQSCQPDYHNTLDKSEFFSFSVFQFKKTIQFFTLDSFFDYYRKSFFLPIAFHSSFERDESRLMLETALNSQANIICFEAIYERHQRKASHKKSSKPNNDLLQKAVKFTLSELYVTMATESSCSRCS